MTTLVGLRLLSSNENQDDSGESTHDPIAVMLFLFFGLCLGILVLQILSRLKTDIPYTIVVFVVGVICSLFSNLRGGGVFSQSINDWVSIDADLIVFIFLPPLVFGEAMNLNWHHVKGAFLPSCLLAGPGVAIGALLMGVFVKYVLPYNWAWELAFCFGSTVAATDTVAVLSLMKSAGASQKLSMLITGESLLNDGTAMVLFILFYRMLEGYHFTVGEVIEFFLYSTLGSCSIGIASGFLIVYWLRLANRAIKEIDVIIQISITLCAAYLVFFITQYILRISGVLACCAAGVILAWLAPPIILSRESMHSVWSIVEWAGNTLIFLLAGLIIGHRILDDVSSIDWMYMLLLYVALMFIRLFIIACLLPFLRMNNHQVTLKEGLFISWAGLRGALSIALALVLQSESQSASSLETSRILFYVGGMATLTLIVNATLSGKLLHYLELIDDSAVEKELVMNAIKKRLKKKMLRVLDDVSKQLEPLEIEEIRLTCSLLRDVQGISIYPRETDLSTFQSVNPLSRSPSNDFKGTNPGKPEPSISQASHPISPRESDMSIRTAINSFQEINNDEPEDTSNDVKDNIATDPQPFRRISLTNRILSKSDRPILFPRSNTEINIDQRYRSINKSQDNNISQHSLFRNYILPDRIVNHSNHIQNRIADVSRLLSQDRRQSPLLSPDLLAYVRGIFLEIVRVKYWQNIDHGKIPRLSFSAQFLLYSIDVGLDELRSEDGLQDWYCIKRYIESKSWLISLLEWIYVMKPNWPCLSFIDYSLTKAKSNQDKRNYYILTSFIEAHQEAQRKIHSFIGIEENSDHDNDPLRMTESTTHTAHGRDEKHSRTQQQYNSSNDKNIFLSPEELKIKDESEKTVIEAKLKLDSIPKSVQKLIQLKQIAKTILLKQRETVKNMMEEGLLNAKHAEEFLSDIANDVANIERGRIQLYSDNSKLINRKLFEKWNPSNDSSSKQIFKFPFNQSKGHTYEPLISNEA